MKTTKAVAWYGNSGIPPPPPAVLDVELWGVDEVVELVDEVDEEVVEVVTLLDEIDDVVEEVVETDEGVMTDTEFEP